MPQYIIPQHAAPAAQNQNPQQAYRSLIRQLSTIVGVEGQPQWNPQLFNSTCEQLLRLSDNVLRGRPDYGVLVSQLAHAYCAGLSNDRQKARVWSIAFGITYEP